MLKSFACLFVLLVVTAGALQTLSAADWIVSTEGVKLPNPYPQPNETCSWTGGKDASGKADGSGLVLWYLDGKLHQVHTARYEHGVAHGLFVLLSPDGSAGAVAFDNGQQIPVQLKVEKAVEQDDPDSLPDRLPELERERAKAEELVRLTKSFVADWDERMKESDAIMAAGMLRYKLSAMDRNAKAERRLRDVQAKIARVEAQ